jgi:hypothetical protein
MAAQLGLTQEEMGEILADQEEWMREEEEHEWRREGHTVPEETHQQQQGQDDDTDARTAPLPLGYTYGMAHDTMHNKNVHAILFEPHVKLNDGAIRAELDHNAIKHLTCCIAVDNFLPLEFLVQTNTNRSF